MNNKDKKYGLDLRTLPTKDINTPISEETMANLLKTTTNLTTSLQSVIDSLTKSMKPLQEMISKLFENIPKLSETFKNFELNEYAKNLAEEAIYYNQDLINRMINKGLFPPIFYLAETNKKNLNSIDFKDLDLIKYYSNSMKDIWQHNDYPQEIQSLINEIHDSFIEEKIYTTTLAMFTLLEYRLNISSFVKTGGIYKTYKDNLENKAFNKGLSKEHLLKHVKNDIFKDTDETNSLTRHIVHGHKIDLINYESMLSLIFLYDFINNTLKIDEESLLTLK